MRFDRMPRPLRSIIRFMLHDEVRLFEVFSAMNLLAWAVVMWSHPDLLERPHYQNFGGAASQVWPHLFLAAGLFQWLAMILRHCRIARLRFPAMAIAAGLWAVVAANFWVGTLTTANVNYTLIAIGCAVSGVYLGWKPTSCRS